MEASNLKIFDGVKLFLTILISVISGVGMGSFAVGSANSEVRMKFEAIDTRFQTDERRMQNVEDAIQQIRTNENQIGERLTRVEEDIKQELETSRRIETMVQTMARRSK